MPRKTDALIVAETIEMISLRKKQFVSVPRRIMPKLQKTVSELYPKAKFNFFGLSGGSNFQVVRTSSADSFKNVNRCKGCNYPVHSPDTYCGECLCEDDCGY